MQIRSLCLSLMSGLVVAGSALAQSPPNIIGEASDVKGLVTMSQGASVGSVVDRTPLVEGARVVTSSSGSVLLKIERGCDIRLEPNEAVIVSRMSCEAVLAAVQSTVPAGSGLALGAGPFIGLGVAALAVSQFNKTSAAALPNPPISGQ